jgi:hypothetical protein
MAPQSGTAPRGEEVGEGPVPTDRWRAASNGADAMHVGSALVGIAWTREDGALTHGPSHSAGFYNYQTDQTNSNSKFKLVQTLTDPKKSFPSSKNLK